MKNICMVGVGYVGLVSGTCFADLGNRVIALDVNAERIPTRRRGPLPIYEPGLEELVRRNVAAGRLSFTTDYREALDGADFAFIAVGTPEGVDGEADLQYLRAAAETIALNMTGPLVIVNKSTVPVGTGDWVADIVRAKQPRPIPFSVVSCPEFLAEGSAISDFMNPARTVHGSLARRGARRRGAAAAPAAPRADHGHRPAHRRDDQVRLQRLPGHEDFLHQRDLQHLRGPRRRRERSGDRHGLR